LVLLVALVVVMLLAARSWQSVAPEAIQITNPGAGEVNVRYNTHGETEAGSSLSRGDLPGLAETQQETDAHLKQVQSALDATNQ
jgi:hypothetical protein